MKKGLIILFSICILSWIVVQQNLTTQNVVLNSTTSIQTVQEGNNKNESFTESKDLLETEVYNDIILPRIDLYCGCTYNEEKNVDLKSCWFKTSWKNTQRSKKIEWEHIVPAENFGQSFKEWREGDVKCVNSKWKTYKWRECAEKVNTEYRLMQADLYNLIPVIWEVNALRSNYQYTQLTQDDIKYTFWECSSKMWEQKFEPRDSVKWLVARASLYMWQAYSKQNIISDKQRKLYEAWDKLYPVTKEECIRYKKIKELQWNDNLVLKERCSGY